MSKTHFRKSEETWNKIAKSFDKTRKKPWENCIDYINNLEKNSIAADFGCGNGRHIIPSATHCKKVYGVDISKELLKIVRKKIHRLNIKNVELIHSNLINTPFKNNFFDSILCIASIHNIKGRNNRIKALSEIKRCLKYNKTALISVWSREQERFRDFFKQNKTSTIGEIGDIEIFWRQDKLDVSRFYHLYSKEEFIKDIKRVNLKIKEFEGVKFHSKKYDDNYFAIIEK